MAKDSSLSVIITAFKEEKTIGHAIEQFLKETDPKKDQLFVVAPDKLTIEEAEKFSPPVEVVKDEGAGKPAALNKVLKKVSGEIVVLSDGDVWIKEDAVSLLVKKFDDPKIGIVSGRPRDMNDEDSMLGFWAHVLTEKAHRLRKKLSEKGEYFDCSGYLLAVRRKLIPDLIPTQTLAEDAYLSQYVWGEGFKTGYAAEAEVFVKFPATFRDWLTQKIRSVGGAAEVFDRSVPMMRGWKQEVKEGLSLFQFCRTPRQFLYIITLFTARGFLWLLIFWKLRVRREPSRRVWRRVESTK